MSLVAYGSSDESENEEETNEQPQVLLKVKTEEEAVKNLTNFKLKLPSPKTETVNNESATNGDDLSNEVRQLNFGALPKPVSVDAATNVTLETDSAPVPRKVDYAKIEKPPKKEKGPAKISIPSLSDVS